MAETSEAMEVPAVSKLLTGNLRQAVFWLAMPAFAEQVLNFLVGFFDTFLAGRISTGATVAVGLSAYMGWLVSMVFGLVGSGTMALVARAWGGGNRAEAERVLNRSLALAVFMGGAVASFIFAVAPAMAGALNLEGETQATVVRYLRLDGLGHIFTGVILAAGAALRGAGNMRASMWVFFIVNTVNVAVSVLLVYGLGPWHLGGGYVLQIGGWGIDGIVGGTIVARFVGAVVMLTGLSRNWFGMRLLVRELTVSDPLVRRILRIGMPAVVDGGLTWTGQFVFLMIIARLTEGGQASATFAAHVIGMRVEGITYLPAVAWGAAAAALVGQSLGAGDSQRAVRAGNEATGQCMILGGVISLVFFAFAPQIYALMHEETSVATVGIPAFRLLAFFQVPLVMLIVYEFALRGAGDTRSPMLVNVSGVLLIRLPLAWYFGIHLEGGLIGAWIGMCADMLLRAVMVTVRFLGRKWLKTRV